MAKMTKSEVEEAKRYFKEQLHEPPSGMGHKFWYDNLTEEDKKYFDKTFIANEQLLWEEGTQTEEDYKNFIKATVDYFNHVDNTPYFGDNPYSNS